MSDQGYICPKCGHIIRPNVVLYDEAINSYAYSDAIDKILKADTLIVGGTSLKVFPFSSLVEWFRGENLIVINKEEINIKNTLFINEDINKVFTVIKKESRQYR